MQDFSKLITNYSLWETGDSFEPIAPERIEPGRDGKRLQTGAVVQPNGDVLFRIFAPDAESVKVIFGGAHVRGVKRYTIDLVKNSEGIFEGTLPYLPNDVGIRDFFLNIDGANVTTPYAPVYFRSNRAANYVTIPDPDFDLQDIKEGVPQGSVVYRTYWSNTFSQWKRCIVYLPAEYYHCPDKKYPVLWLNNGGSEDETTWTFAGKAHHILDNLIAEGKAKPMIVVQCNTMARLPEEKERGKEELYGWRDNLLNDCLPFIESEYRCLTDKWNRAMTGNSMGSMATGFMGFAHPELFGNIGFIAGSIRTHDFHETFEENEQIQWMIDNGDEVGKQYRVLFFSWGEGEFRENQYMPDDLAWLKKQGIIKQKNFHIRLFSPDFCHDWSTFRRGFAEFVQLIFDGKTERY